MANQIEEKKRQKEADEKAQKYISNTSLCYFTQNREYEAKEAARLERERLILQQQQEEEIARERGLATGPSVAADQSVSRRVEEPPPLSDVSRRREMFRADSVAVPPDTEALRSKAAAERQRRNNLFDPSVHENEDDRPLHPMREIPVQQIDEPTPIPRNRVLKPATPIQRSSPQSSRAQHRDSNGHNGVSTAEVQRLQRETALAQESAEALRRGELRFYKLVIML